MGGSFRNGIRHAREDGLKVATGQPGVYVLVGGECSSFALVAVHYVAVDHEGPGATCEEKHQAP